MKKKYTLIISIIVACYSTINAQSSAEQVNHSAWDQILLLNVSDDGMVNYEGVTRDASVFYQYFRYLCTISPEDNWSNEEKLAYWLNVYNATAMKMIIDEYPIESINELENPWKRKSFKTQGVRYSLDDIEHTILRKFGDPRIHFLLNCGSKSSPRLWSRAYTSTNINEALEERTREFINDLQRNQITSHIVKISQVFQWYVDDFNQNSNGVVSFINKYASIKIRNASQIKYITYDWSLNKQEEVTPITSTNN